MKEPLTKVLLAHNHYQWSGGEDVVFCSEAALLQDMGHAVVEYTVSNNYLKSIPSWEAAIDTVWSRSSYRAISEVLNRSRPSVAHFHNTFAAISPAAYYACRDMNVPVVQSLHNFRLMCPAAVLHRENHICEKCVGRSLPWPSIAHACYRNSHAQSAVVAAMLAVHNRMRTWQAQVDIYIALTEFARKKHIEAGLPPEKIVVKPNFIYPDPGPKIQKGDFALFIGRLSPEKGLHAVLRAWQHLPHVPLKLIGDGPLMADILSYKAQNQMDQVQIMGLKARADVIELIKQASFLIFPSEWYEGMPMTIIESYACGLPVIAAKLGAMEEIVVDGRTGLHFTPGEPQSLIERVEWAWTHEQAIQQMGLAARQEYEDKYTAERNYKMLMEIYQRAIQNRPNK